MNSENYQQFLIPNYTVTYGWRGKIRHEFGEVRQAYIVKGLVGQAKAFGLSPKAKGKS